MKAPVTWVVHTNFSKSAAFSLGNYSKLITLFISKLKISLKNDLSGYPSL